MNAHFKSHHVVTASQEILSGAPVFLGTRVPVQTLVEYLEAGETIDDFLQGFPTVSRQQVIAFLEEGLQATTARALAQAA